MHECSPKLQLAQGASTGATRDYVIPNPGLYPIVTHNFAYTELGIIGVLQVTE